MFAQGCCGAGTCFTGSSQVSHLRITRPGKVNLLDSCKPKARAGGYGGSRSRWGKMSWAKRLWLETSISSICDANPCWQDALFQKGNSLHDGLRHKSRLHPVSFQKTRISQFVFTRRAWVSPQLEVKGMSPSAALVLVEGVELFGVCVCVFVCGGRQLGATLE